MTVEIVPHATRGELDFIIEHLRAEDRHEFAAVGMAPNDVTYDFLAHSADYWLFRRDFEPVFIWGTHQTAPGVRQLWGFGTARTPNVMLTATKWGRRTWLPETFQKGVRRIEVRVPEASDHSLCWLQSLGMRIECTLPGFSVTGERMYQLSYTQHDFKRAYPHVHLSKTADSRRGSNRTYEVVVANSERS